MTGDLVVGVLHPGEMGAAVGAQLRGQGRTVLWASAGRSSQTAGRAAAAGLADARTVPELVRRSHVVLSICPPHAAAETALAAAGTSDHPAGGAPLFVDANAISPASTREVAEIVAASGRGFVDGGIVGPPPQGSGGTRLYVSAGPAGGAERVASLFAGTDVDARVVPGGAGAASAVKMAYAAWTKGTAALVLAVRALARAEGVEDALAREWALSQPQLAGRLDAAGRSALAKGWRWVAEMEEISAAFTAAGLPGGFHQAAAEVFSRSPHTGPDGDGRKDGAGPDAGDVVDALLEERPG